MFHCFPKKKAHAANMDDVAKHGDKIVDSELVLIDFQEFVNDSDLNIRIFNISIKYVNGICRSFDKCKVEVFWPQKTPLRGKVSWGD